MNKLTKRQQTIVNLAKKAKITIDVGCDHGFVGTQLLKDKTTKFLIASDISEKCANKAKILLKNENLTDQSDVRVGNGITAQENEKIDQVVIAGMGGKEIIEILQNFGQKTKTHFVLQPMKELFLLRKFLSENGFKILKDFVIKDKNKFYHMLTAKFGRQKLSKIQQKWGAKSHKKNSEYFEWLNLKEQKIKTILKTMPDGQKQNEFLNCLKEIKIITAKRS